MNGKYRIFILGAGFSKPAGFPIASQLWSEIRILASRMTGRAAKFNDDLENYIAFRNDCDGTNVDADGINFEEFMEYLDIEHCLGLRGSDTWSRDGNEGTVVTKYLMSKILARQLIALDTVPELYLEFAKRLDLTDIVITFNYDSLLERALDAVGKPYRLFSTRYKEVSEFSGTVDSSREEVLILKVHGSIDWFDRAPFESLTAHCQKQGAPGPEHVIFSSEKELGLVRLVDGPRHDDDPLRSVYRATKLAALYEKDFLFLATPQMLSPSAAKLVYAANANDFWNGMGNAGIFNGGLSIIGFSLPQQDDYAKQIIHTLVTNYQRHNQFDQLGDRKPAAPLTIVDRFANADAERSFKERYRFVDWEKARLHGEGFNLAALDDIFS